MTFCEIAGAAARKVVYGVHRITEVLRQTGMAVIKKVRSKTC